MLVRVLGPLEVHTPDGRQRIRALKWRELLARLAIDVGTPVSLDALIDELWTDGQPTPAGAVNLVHGYVSRLRSLLGDHDRTLLVTRSPGYELALEPDQLDSLLFERLAAEGDRAAREQDPRLAADRYAAALGLWRGTAYADVPVPAVTVEATRLAERRLTVLEARVDADLSSRRPSVELVAELKTAVRDNPFREHLAEQLMLALYRSGRQADALQIYQDLFHRLDRELGVRPGDPLNRLQQRILAAEPEVESAIHADPGNTSDDAGPGTRAALRQPTTQHPASSNPIPHQLPADLTDFTGRTAELSAVDDWLADADASRAPSVVALSGGGGLGKTSLALHWAHRVSGEFADGQLYVNLRGFSTTEPLPAARALSMLLRSIGVPPDQVPSEIEEAAALYRTQLAERRMLVILDNAVDSSQVEPLLPGAGCSRAVITGRDALVRLAARGHARMFGLDGMDSTDAEQLAASIIGTDRVAAEPNAFQRMVRLCGGLPLATRLVAAQLAGHPTLRIADQLDALSGGGLAAFDLDDDDPEASVRKTFELSFDRLDHDLRRTFCLLALLPGDSFAATSVGPLIDAAPDVVGHRLTQLTRRGMLSWTRVPGRSERRYLLHDLLRSYAAERATSLPTAHLDGARSRLFDWYAETAATAVGQALPPTAVRLEPADPDPKLAPWQTTFADAEAALGWLDAERDGLRALAVDSDAYIDDDRAPDVWRLAETLRTYYFHQRYPDDWLAVAAAGVRSAGRCQHNRAEAAAELSLAQAYRSVSRFRDAAEHAERTIRLAEGSDGQEIAAAGWNELAVLQMEQGNFRSAPQLLEHAVAIYRATGNSAAEAGLLVNLGQAARMLGDLKAAADHFEHALAMLPDGPTSIGSMTHASLGEVYRLLGRMARARAELDQAQAAARDSGQRYGVASMLGNVSALEIDCGNLDAATTAAERALQMAEEQHNDRLIAAGLLTRSEARLAAGDADGAFSDAQAAVATAGALGSDFERIYSEVLAARSLLLLEQYDEVIRIARRAAEQAGRFGYRIQQADAEALSAEAELRLGNTGPARDRARLALSLHHDSGHRPGEQRVARLLTMIGN